MSQDAFDPAGFFFSSGENYCGTTSSTYMFVYSDPKPYGITLANNSTWEIHFRYLSTSITLIGAYVSLVDSLDLLNFSLSSR